MSDTNTYEPCVANMLAKIRSLELVDFVINFNESSGFMWSNDERVNKIGNSTLNDGHSGASFACCLRQCQQILRQEKAKKENNISDKDETPSCGFCCNTSQDIAVEDIDYEKIKNNGSNYLFYEEMDEHNKKATDVAATYGIEKAAEFMTKGLRDGTMDYATMRSLYG
jgi:hypothetical protein